MTSVNSTCLIWHDSWDSTRPVQNIIYFDMIDIDLDIMFSSMKETLDFHFPIRNSTMLLTYTDVTIDNSLMKTSIIKLVKQIVIEKYHVSHKVSLFIFDTHVSTVLLFLYLFSYP